MSGRFKFIGKPPIPYSRVFFHPAIFVFQCFRFIRSKVSGVLAFPALFLCGNSHRCRKSERAFPAGGHRCGHGLPLLYIALCVVHLRATPIVVFKCPVEHCRVGKSIGFQPPHKVDVLLLVNKGFLLFSFRALAAAFDWVLVFAHQGNALCKECFFWGMTFSAIKQAILAIIILSVFGNNGNGLFQSFFNRLYRLSPSLNV